MIIIVDYNMGNLHSVKKKLDGLGVDSMISSDPEMILKADKLILPGVGHFGKAMDNLKILGLIEPLNQAVQEQKTPILGICLGMQLMAKTSEEGNCTGLGWFDAEVLKFRVHDSLRYKVPHTGWNTISVDKDVPLMNGIGEGSEFYFVHSFYLKANDPADIMNYTEFEDRFVSGISKGNIFGVQYHPEKSHDAGTKLLKNFCSLLC